MPVLEFAVVMSLGGVKPLDRLLGAAILNKDPSAAHQGLGLDLLYCGGRFESGQGLTQARAVLGQSSLASRLERTARIVRNPDSRFIQQRIDAQARLIERGPVAPAPPLLRHRAHQQEPGILWDTRHVLLNECGTARPQKETSRCSMPDLNEVHVGRKCEVAPAGAQDHLDKVWRDARRR